MMAGEVYTDGQINIRPFAEADLPQMIDIWNEIVADGRTFPQEKSLTPKEAQTFFSGQYTAVAEVDHMIAGLYILHPNYTGRLGHIANASYGVSSRMRGRHIGEALVRDSLIQAKKQGYRILQFNAVVISNVHAYHLYRKLGFEDAGVIPGGYRNGAGEYEDIRIMYHRL